MYSREFRERAVTLVASGLSATAAARELGCGKTAVVGWCRSVGLRLRHSLVGGPVRRPVVEAAPLPPRARLDDERRALIADRLGGDPRLGAEVVRRLALRWSPEQVSASLQRDFPRDEEMRVSHETICRALYVQGRGSLREELEVELVLRSGWRSRRRRRPPAEPRGRRTWVEDAGIALRPPEADPRAVPGHWEGTARGSAPTAGPAWSRSLSA